MMWIRKKAVVSIGEIWFDQPLPAGVRVDVVERLQASHPYPQATVTDFPTLIIDLSNDEQTILNAFKKDTRYEVRRGQEKDRFIHVQTDPATAIDEFEQAYEQFSAQKGLPPINSIRLRQYIQQNCLCITQVSDPTENKLSWHVFYQAEKRVRLLHSISLFRDIQDSAARALVGRAGRYHHWADICAFKQSGVLQYDLGGWYDGQDDEERLKINKFKEEFGAQLVREFNCEYAATALGRIYLKGRRYIRQFRGQSR